MQSFFFGTKRDYNIQATWFLDGPKVGLLCHFLYGKDGRGKCFSTTSELFERNDGANAPVTD